MADEGSVAASSHAEQLPTVVYITGSGRSGSTLLERVLGGVPGVVNVGELTGLFPRVAAQDYNCGCGSPFSSCDFWGGVGSRAFGGWDSAWVGKMAEIQGRVTRQRHLLPLAVSGVRSRQFGADLDRYLHALASLYQAIAAESGSRVVVDASKSPIQLLALRQIPGLDVRVLHLLRDPRGVAYSWSKSEVVLPHLRGSQKVMTTYRPHKTALQWSAFQAESSVLSSLSTHGHRMRYEELVDAPASAVDAALRALALSPEPGWLSHIEGRQVDLGPTHGLAGSRSRFETGRIELSLDDEWRSKLEKRSRDTVTMISLPQLLMYGYLRRSNDGRTGE